MFGPNGPVNVPRPDEETEATGRRGYAYALPTIAVTGTAIASGVTEAQIVTGGETLIFTLTNGTFVATTPFNALRAAFAAALVGDGGGGAGAWNVAVGGEFVVSNVVRTSATVATITTPAASAYSISADEIVSMAIPGGLVINNGGGTLLSNGQTSGGSEIVSYLIPSPATFTITAA